MIPDSVEFVGIPWFHKKDYKKLRKTFVDGHGLPSAFQEWHNKAQAIYNQIKMRGGVTVERVYIDPDTFPAWCRDRGLNIDAQARTRFANEFVARKYTQQG
jgi:hypothetical protein